MFTSQSNERIMRLQLHLRTTKKGNTSMVEYLQKMKTLMDNLAVVAHPVIGEDLVLYILGRLRPYYDVLVVLSLIW